ncbi:putative porin [Mesorhizobium plurifarium]|uniref:Porin n=1 Tax=Mesorhizobium plurifarium TaxID=69974 RepID=A0A0K2VXT3_MESPL|nr:putative porin [Mesorhizobium plurifarium]
MFRYLLAPAIFGAAALFAAPSQAAVEYVKVCSAYGPNYYYSPGTDTCINAQTGVTKRQVDNGEGGTTTVTGKTALAAHVDDIDNRITRAFENASISAALAAPDLVQGEHFGLRVNWGNAGYANAFGITGAAVLSEGFDHGGRLTGTLGIAFAGRQVGGSAGLQFSW